MRYYAVYDTNVLVSSLLSKNKDSSTVQVVDAIISGEIIPLYSSDILEEYKEVLNRPKFPFSKGRINALLDLIKHFGIAVVPSPTGEILADMDDLPFYEVVMEKRDDDAHLITGNVKHFPQRNYIVTPSEMMAIIRKKKNQN